MKPKPFRAIAITLMLVLFCAASPVFSETPPVTTGEYAARTSDGWDLSITRYSGGPYKIKKAAVVLCHGFNINSSFWDLGERVSLARYLAKNGYDVWAPSLRGSGDSSKPLISNIRSMVKLEIMKLPRRILKMPTDIVKFNWTIDDHILKDVPSIIDVVKKESRFSKIYWIGHSMGGIIMYGYLETMGQKNIAGFIPIGSMMIIPHPLTGHLKTVATQKPLMNASLLINTTMASQLRNVTLGTIKNPIEDLLLNRENMYDDIVFRFFRIAIDDTAPGVVSQFSDSIRTGSMLSKNRAYNYTDNLHLVKVPIMIMGGGADGFVSESSLRATYEAVSSGDKGIMVFSRLYGYSADYGHCDLVLGKNSEKEVYPVILNWLDKRALGE